MIEGVNNMTQTTARTALVTGAAGGIGAAVTSLLLREGNAVLAVDRDEAGLARLSEAAPTGARLSVLAGDVSEESLWSAAVAQAEREFGTVDVLVNNAGISPKRDGVKVPGDEVQLDEWRRVLDVNLTSAFLGTRAVAAGMKAQSWGRVVNMSSQAGRTGAVIAGVAYGASKAGMLGLTRAFAGELGPHGVTVNAIAPGRIETPMMRNGSDAVNEAALARIPVRRFGQPADLAAIVLFLVQEKAGFINGATIDANGGSFMA
jgi:3-oxoacyl-[acyl-carrier protein] reductase